MFGCDVRYISHVPATSGDMVRVRLSPGAACGSPAAGWVVPPVIDRRGVVRSVSVDRNLGRDADLTIRWSRNENFAVVPPSNGRGLRVLVSRPETKRAKVTVRR